MRHSCRRGAQRVARTPQELAPVFPAAVAAPATPLCPCCMGSCPSLPAAAGVTLPQPVRLVGLLCPDLAVVPAPHP